MYHASVRMRAALLFALAALLGCEKPRERACRSLVLQAANAEQARATVTPDPRTAVDRARSAARWLDSNAVEDPDLKNDAHALAGALERLAGARLRLIDASAELGAADAADLVARADRIIAHVDAAERASTIRMKPCPFHEPDALIEDPRCSDEYAVTGCGDVERARSLAAHAERCANTLEHVGANAVTPSEAAELATAMRATASWAKSLPDRPLAKTLATARTVHDAIEERGRADADITQLVAALKTKCGS